MLTRKQLLIGLICFVRARSNGGSDSIACRQTGGNVAHQAYEVFLIALEYGSEVLDPTFVCGSQVVESNRAGQKRAKHVPRGERGSLLETKELPRF